VQELSSKIKSRLIEKGRGAFVSTHEILGIITEEYYELVDAVRSDVVDDVRSELLDIAVGCIFGIACINENTMKQQNEEEVGK
jgi:NTP pyrophosphatase (non-canonical NTP hydrolase)